MQWKGQIKIIKNGVLLPVPFLDIEDIVFWDNWERGMFCVAFDPNFDINGWFYVYFIRQDPFVGKSAIYRYTVSADPDVADPASVHKVFQLPQVGHDHNGGHIEFGPDGFLWLALGDGGVISNTRSQELDNLFGKMLRINPYQDEFALDVENNYAIPIDNPFVSVPNAKKEIWASGLRNPFRFCFDEATGDLYVGDVGHGNTEEIDYAPAASTGAENFGWPWKEGTDCWRPAVDCDLGGVTTDPIHEYPHPEGYAITGGRVYNGTAIPELVGHYIYGDFITDRTWSLRMENGTAVDFREWTESLIPSGVPEKIDNIVAYGVDGLGEMYVCDLYQGEIFKLVPGPQVTGVALSTGLDAGPQVSAFPNPFRSAVRFEIQLDRPSDLEVSVYSVTGRLVRRLQRQVGVAAGTRTVVWDGTDGNGLAAPAGVYLMRAVAGEKVKTGRVVLVR